MTSKCLLRIFLVCILSLALATAAQADSLQKAADTFVVLAIVGVAAIAVVAVVAVAALGGGISGLFSSANTCVGGLNSTTC